MNEPVTVITLTCGRPALVRRAIESVRSQDYSGFVEHAIVVDACADSAAALAGMEGGGHPQRRVKVVVKARPATEQGVEALSRCSVYGRQGRLINAAVRSSALPWIALLDDDNTYEPDHLRTLVATAHSARTRVAHSWRRIYHHDGTPYLEPRFPWVDDVQRAADIFSWMCARGVWVAGTNILCDRAGPLIGHFRNSTIAGPLAPVMMVDTSVWLVRRDVMLANPLPETYSNESIERGDCFDDMLLKRLLEAGVGIASSLNPSVRYYLGGISNSLGGQSS